MAPACDAAASINDAPVDGLGFEPEVYTPARVRAYEAAQAAFGNRLYRVLARHTASGRLVGNTVVAVDGEHPWVGKQHDTSVDARHRGHRLGLLLKADMVVWLREAEPELRQIDTTNALTNPHMVAVNERLGFEVLGHRGAYQRTA